MNALYLIWKTHRSQRLLFWQIQRNKNTIQLKIYTIKSMIKIFKVEEI
jgi:hypothetical protein